MERVAALLFAEVASSPDLLAMVKGLAGQGNGRWVYPHKSTDDRGYTEWGMDPSDAPASFTDPGKYDSPRTVFYDPARASVKPGEFRPEVTYTNPNAIRRLDDANLPPGLLWRGMSDEEYQASKARGYFESSGTYNIGGEHGDNGPGSPGFQAGRTFFTTRPGSADSYASSFAPWQYTPTFSRPAHVVGIPDQPDAPRGPLGNEPNSHEVGLTGRIPFDSVAHHWVGHVSTMSPGRWVGYLNSDPPYRGGSAGASLEWEPGDVPTPRLARLLFAEDLLKDPRYVDPAYFTGIHEMSHALDLAGHEQAQGMILPLLLRHYGEETGQDDPDTDPRFWDWVKTQFPKQGQTSAAEMLAHAFTEVRLNPGGAKPIHRALYDTMVQMSQGNPNRGATSYGPYVPAPMQQAVQDMQRDYPQVDVGRVNLTNDHDNGPAYLSFPSSAGRYDPTSPERPRLEMDMQYAVPPSGRDETKDDMGYDPQPLTDWFDQHIDNQEYPRWQSTMAGEPWPEDAIEDMDTEFDQPKTAALLFGAIFPNYDEGREHLEPDDPYVADPVPSGATWYHVSPSPMKPGDRLRPFGGERPYGKMYDAHPQFKHRDQHVWTEHDPYVSEAKWANDAKPYIYEITPDETPLPWNGTGSEGWVTPGATIKREISHTGWLPQVDFTDAGRTASIFADPDGRGVWKTAVDGRVEFLAAPHAR